MGPGTHLGIEMSWMQFTMSPQRVDKGNRYGIGMLGVPSDYTTPRLDRPCSQAINYDPIFVLINALQLAKKGGEWCRLRFGTSANVQRE
jgi:hypothetical protein